VSKILIVDDERSYRRYLTRHLAREGHEVRSASSRDEAIEIGAEFPPDVLILDWMLDGSCTLEVAEAFQEADPDLRTILITGFASERARNEASDIRIFRFLEKPFDMSDLSAAVRDAVAARASIDAQPRRRQ
jgi:two-component system NtrC family response regulator/two-component system nitrogen regulation response regulator GlnG